MGTDILTEIRAAGVTLSVDGGNLVATPKAAITDDIRALIRTHKLALLEALAHPAADRARPTPKAALPPLSDAAEARRQKLLALLARDGSRYAVYVEDPNTDPVVMALAVRDKGTCEISVARERYDAFRILTLLKEWERESLPQAGPGDPEPARLWWRVAITEPGGRTVEVDTPSGMSLGEWEAYSERHYAPESAVTPILQLPKPQAPANLDEALAAAVESLEGITPEVFRSLLSPEDIKDIEAGDIPVETLKAYAASFAEGIRSGRVALPERTT